MYKENLIVFIVFITSISIYSQEYDPQLGVFNELLLTVPIEINTFDDEITFEDSELLQFRLEGKTIKSHDRYSKLMLSKKSSVALSYSTKEPNRELLEKFSIVQFIKGCRRSGNFMTTRGFWGKERQDFHHPQWEIDSIDTNPIYQSFNEYNHSGYYFFKPKYPTHPLYSNSKNDEIDFLSSDEIISNTLYTSDSPSESSVNLEYNNVPATNTFLEFKTCIYKTNDIPQDLENPSASGIKAAPLHCFYWESKHVWNKEKQDFTSPAISTEEFCKLP